MEFGFKTVIGILLLVSSNLTGGVTGIALMRTPEGFNRPQLVLQTGHSESITAVVFGPDDRWLATASSDNSIRIWERLTGRELRLLSGHSGPVKSLACSPDGKFLVSGSSDRTVRIWNVETGIEMSVLDNKNAVAEAVAFSSSGSLVAAGSSDGSVKIWNAINGTAASEFSGSPDRVTSMAFGPDNGSIAFGDYAGIVKIFNIAEKKARRLQKHTDRINTLAFSSDGQSLASGSADKTVRIWRISGGREVRPFGQHGKSVLSVRFVTGGELMSADSGQNIKRWDALTGRELRSIPKAADADEFIESESAAFSSDGSSACFSLGSREAMVVNTDTGKTAQRFKNHTIGFNAVAVSPDKHWLAAAGMDNSVRLWDLETGECLPPLTGHTGWVRSVAFAGNDRLVTASIDGTITIRDILSGLSPKVLRPSRPEEFNSVAVSSGGKWLAAGGKNKVVWLWDMTTLTESKPFTGHTGEVTSVAFSPDGRTIASTSTDRSVRLWDVATGVEKAAFSEHSDSVFVVAFSPDGKLIASAGADKKIVVRDLASGATKSLGVATTGIETLQFNPNGQGIVSGGNDSLIRIRQLDESKPELALKGHFGTVTGSSFSPDGSWIASASKDGSIIIWDAMKGDKLAMLLSLRDEDGWLAVSPSGFFDGSPQGWRSLLWRFSGTTFDVRPVEVFFSEFFQPGILPKLLAGKPPSAPVDITKKDRRQPVVQIFPTADIGDPVNSRTVKVRINVAEAPLSAGEQSGSGARDVRLFRNGSLIKSWDSDVLPKGKTETTLEIEASIVEGKNEFTAYAFNRDNVKSEDAEYSVTGGEELRRQGFTYLFAIGVGMYENPYFNLNYIDTDVKDFSKAIREKQIELTSDDRVRVISLVNEKATKSAILSTLGRFSGTQGSAAPAGGSGFESRMIQPEDTLIVYFSGHGYSSNDRFYMIPHDVGFRGSNGPASDADWKMITEHSISDRELEAAFRGIDAANILLIIDACDSGQILESDDKRQGPMNSKGLAQFAYEKGMFVLTATQPKEDAYVSSDRKQSYLTFALVKEGLLGMNADLSPKDGSLYLREWFDFAARRVPEIRNDDIQKAVQAKKLRKVAVSAGGGVQRPKAFYRRQREQKEMLVARTWVKPPVSTQPGANR